MEWIVIIGYGLSLTLICVFSLGQLNLTLHYLKKRKRVNSLDEISTFPMVTIQLPVYNEKYVVERLLDAVAQIHYPKELLEIQVLDDSTDETTGLIHQKVKAVRAAGLEIQHIRRPDRTGFKAGALQFGLERAKGDFLAIFDADFLPERNFLISTLPAFEQKEIGMVQTRWGHINADYSLMTRMQAFGLDAHFTIEQGGRHLAGSFINFNGTGGIWRKKCIEDAGGWHYDTLTEDLDLSYRAQLKGWRFDYLEDVVSPAELPVVIPAIKSQQYRWNKGAAETARKNLGAVLRSSLSIEHKIRAVLHLFNSSVFFFLLMAAILSIPMLYIKEGNRMLSLLFDLGTVFIIGFIAIGIFYWVASKAVHPIRTGRYYLVNFPLFMTFSMGMALHNSIAILEGLAGIRTPFVRTPKFNITSRSDTWQGNTYLKHRIAPATIVEGLLALYFVFGIVSGFMLKDYGLIFFHLMLAVGFGAVFAISLKPVGNAA